MRFRYKATNKKPTTLKICCSDPRFRIAFCQFVRDELMLRQGEFVPINVAGGPASLAHQKTKKADFNFVFNQIIFFLKHFGSIEKIILISHEDCGFYRTIKNHQDEEDKEKKDLPRAKNILNLLLPHIAVEAYYASFADARQEEIIFEKVG